MNAEFESVKCLICGSEDHQKISNKGAHGFPVSVVLCKRCGLVFLNPRWSSNRYQRFYETEYDKFYREGSGGNETIVQIVDRLKRLDCLPSEPENILDIGSGKGISLMYLRNHLYPTASYFAIEPSVSCQELLHKNGIVLIADQIEKEWEEDYHEKFDLVIMRHVLEHFLDPVAVLQKVKFILKKGGLLYLAVPNALNPSRPLSNHFRNVHTYYFNKWSITNTLRLAGLEPSFLLEGDHFQQHELVCLVVKDNLPSKTVEIDSEHVGSQLRVYQTILSKEGSFFSKIKNKIKKIIFLQKK